MDWTQTLAIIATLIGAVFTFYRLTRDEIAVIREDMKRMDNLHREDIQRMDAKWDNALQKMDEKWERLFERLLIQDQQQAK
jgi:hypothetical protein